MLVNKYNDLIKGTEENGLNYLKSNQIFISPINNGTNNAKEVTLVERDIFFILYNNNGRIFTFVRTYAERYNDQKSKIISDKV